VDDDKTQTLDLRVISPNLPREVMGKLSAFIEVKKNDAPHELTKALRQLQINWASERWSLELRAVALLVADLIDQGWAVGTGYNAIYLQPPGLQTTGESSEDAKTRIRKSLQVGRDRQLTDPGVSAFIERMHRTKNGETKPRIHRLIDDGNELAMIIDAWEDDGADPSCLQRIVDPYVQVCDSNERCKYSGLRTIDIWRYFRHTWSLEYRSIPGRQMPLLVRNAARPNHPIIGIAMLASPVVRTKPRDNWIGWNFEPFVANLQSGVWPPKQALKALRKQINQSIDAIRTDDLVNPAELKATTENTVLRLERRAAGAAVERQHELQRLYAAAELNSAAVKSQRDPSRDHDKQFDWKLASEEPLFLMKRAETLAKLLGARLYLDELDWTKPGAKLLDFVLKSPAGVKAVNTGLLEIRKIGLSTQVADMSVCGAVAPYNALLGGKLVALLMASSEVVKMYRKRYGEQVSLISSQMAGRPIRKSAELKVLTTTSLYGNGSSQYNRLKLRKKDFAPLTADIDWRELAITAGFGTVHMSPVTVKVLRELSEKTHLARRVNNRFGEGASPRLRQIREAVDALGIDSNMILNHATPRIAYGCELHPDAIQELMGFKVASKTKASRTVDIAEAWRKRWLLSRMRKPQIREALRRLNANSVAAQLDPPSLEDLQLPLGDVGESRSNGVATGTVEMQMPQEKVELDLTD
jgi:hypothetical protein